MLLYGADDDVCKWVSQKLCGRDDCFKGDKAIGIVKNGFLVCGVVYSKYVVNARGDNVSMELSIASIDKSWATRHNLRAFFEYPFIQVGLKRIQTLCSAKEGEIIMFNKRLGFRPEGFHKEAWPSGGDAISWGMLKSECKWVK